MTSSPATKALGVAIGAVLLQMVLVIAFAWPSVRSAPNDVPLVVAGPPAATAQIADRLEHERPGAFEIERLPDEAAARQAITDRDAYGAIVVTPRGPRVLTASAASAALAQQLSQQAQRLSNAPSTPVEDIVAAPKDDPRGAGFSAMVLPLIISALAGAVLITFLISSIAWRAAGLFTFAILGGLAVAWLAQGWLGILSGPYLAVSGVLAFGILAGTGTVAGLAALAGERGLGLGALLLVLLGNPLSGATSAPELLPSGWGELGQLLPPGATVSMLRSASFFDGAAIGGPLTVQSVWAAVALALLAVAALKRRGSNDAAEQPSGRPAPVPS